MMLTSLFRFNIVFKCSGFHREEYAAIVFLVLIYDLNFGFAEALAQK
jgi:hypothetical protein